MPGPELPPSLAANPVLARWVRVRSDGIVEVRSGKVELGQGVLTALAQIAADELDVDVTRIQMGPAARVSMQHSTAAQDQVCAEGRRLYLEVAAAKLAATTEELDVADGQITGP